MTRFGVLDYAHVGFPPSLPFYGDIPGMKALFPTLTSAFRFTPPRAGTDCQDRGTMAPRKQVEVGDVGLGTDDLFMFGETLRGMAGVAGGGWRVTSGAGATSRVLNIVSWMRLMLLSTLFSVWGMSTVSYHCIRAQFCV